MGLVGLVTRATARHRWRSWLALCLLVSLGGGLVLAAADAGDRTATALPRFVAAHGFDAFLYDSSKLTQLAKLPEVASVATLASPATGPPVCACARSLSTNENFALTDLSPTQLTRYLKVVSGRMPTRPDEVLASYTLQRDYGVHLGTVFRMRLFAPSQRAAVFANDNVEPSGQTLALRVVGISVIEFELPGTGPTSYDLYGTQALAESLRNRSVPYYWYLVTLRHGSAGLPQFEAQARALGALGVTDEDSFASTVSSSIRPQAVGWLALAILLALIALIAIGQALSRQAIIEADSYGALRALGATPRQLLFVGLARAIVVALVGAVGSVLLAFLLSPLSPVGEARLVDPSSGFSFDAQVLLLGGLAATVAVLALGVWPSSRTARISRPRPTSTTALSSRLVSQLSGAGVPPTVVIGVRHALERGRGRNSVPVGPALLGAVLAVTALSATAVFSSSLTHLTATPALYGQPFNAWFSAESSVGLNRAMLSNIERGRAISGITVGFSGDVSINGTVVNALVGSSIRGPVLVTAISGRDPAAADEVALGVSTLREVGAHIGSLVTVTLPTPTGSTRKASFRVVGSAVFPPDFGTGRLGAGAVFSLQGVLGSACPTGRAQTDCYSRLLQTTDGSVLVRAADTPGAEAYLARLERIYSSQLNLPVPPTDLVNFGEAVNFPLLFGVALVLFGVATLVHLLVASVSRRRRETGLLKAIGFVRQQVALAVTWQTTTIAAVGIVVGVPVGIAVGRAVWQLFAENLGVFPEIQVSTEWILAVGVGTLVVANLLAVGPAIVAARLRPANLLRSE